MNGTAVEHWFPGGIDPGAGLRVFCFPPAGGGAGVFRGWGAGVGTGVALCPARLPGRETRMGEAPFRELGGLVDALHGVLRPHLDRPFALYGHSMGALIVFELARQLRREGSPLPERLVVSGRAAPQLPPGKPPVHDLPDAEFVQELRRLGATPEEVLQSDEMMQLLLPLLRADFAVCETYHYRQEPPLPMPLLAAGGEEDPEVSREGLVAWGEHTAGAFTCEMFAGGHFFPFEAGGGFLASMLGWLEGRARGG